MPLAPVTAVGLVSVAAAAARRRVGRARDPGGGRGR